MSVYIIAEAGVNHNGDINIAKKLVDVAVDAGADAIKFQMFKADKLTTKEACLADYQKTNLADSTIAESQKDMLRKLELSEKAHITLKKYCEKKGIDFLSSPFDIESMRFLVSIGMDIIKIPSGEITNYPYLIEAANSGKKIILSTGMCSMDEVRNAVDIFRKIPNVTLLHCNTQYPTPYEDVNLKAMIALKDEFDCEIGYSDHTLGIEIPCAAVVLGATIIEKHFTIDKNMEGPDHKASLEPDELKAMISAIRHIEVALGDGEKRVTDSERSNIIIVRKSIVAARDIKKGEIFSEENLTTKRPGDGISPMRWNEIIGTEADRDYEKDDKIRDCYCD